MKPSLFLTAIIVFTSSLLAQTSSSKTEDSTKHKLFGTIVSFDGSTIIVKTDRNEDTMMTFGISDSELRKDEKAYIFYYMVNGKKVAYNISSHPVMNTASQNSVRKRLFSGLGGNVCFNFSSFPTGNWIKVGTTINGFTTYDNEDVKTADQVWGLNVDLFEFYFNERISLGLTTFCGWAGTSNPDIKNLVHSENSFFNSTDLMANYNFWVNDISGTASSDPGKMYGYFGAGFASNYIGYIKASATLSDGTRQEVTTTYLPAAGMVFQIGIKGVWTSQLNFAIRYGFSFGNESINNLTVKQNGIQVPSNTVHPSPISPTYLMLLVNWDYGWL